MCDLKLTYRYNGRWALVSGGRTVLSRWRCFFFSTTVKMYTFFFFFRKYLNNTIHEYTMKYMKYWRVMWSRRWKGYTITRSAAPDGTHYSPVAIQKTLDRKRHRRCSWSLEKYLSGDRHFYVLPPYTQSTLELIFMDFLYVHNRLIKTTEPVFYSGTHHRFGF